MSPLPVVRAVTVVVALYIETTGSIQARVGVTWVNINLAVESGIANLAFTGVACYLFVTRGPILTREAAAFTDFCLAVPTSITRHARTMVGIYQVHTVSSVLTLMMAIVYVDVAVLPCPSSLTVTLVSSLKILAGVGIYTGTTAALVRVQLTVSPAPTWGTQAPIAVDAVHACAPMETRI